MAIKEAQKERSAAVSLLQRLNRIWLAVLLMVLVTVGATTVSTLSYIMVRGARIDVGYARNAAEGTERVAQIINGCVNPEGECAKRFASISEQRTRDHLDALVKTLNSSRDEILAGQEANAAELLRQVRETSQNVEQLAARNKELSDQVAVLLAEIVSLRASGTGGTPQVPPPVGTSVSVPPPSNSLCSVLPSSLGGIIGCIYG